MPKKLAIIRTNTGQKTCPFGLSIPTACSNAGEEAVARMQALGEVRDEQRESVKKANRRVYRHYKDCSRCPYADKISKDHDAVHCDYGEAGEKMRDFPMRPSPYYPRIFFGLGASGLMSNVVDMYWDNPDSRNLFTGIYSIYASTGEVNLHKGGDYPETRLFSRIGDDET